MCKLLKIHQFLFVLTLTYGFAAAQVFPKSIKIYSKDGVSISSYDFNSLEPMLKIQNDTTYVINFWATWCQPCVAELPDFEKINEKYQLKKVKVILVSLDMPKQIESRLIPFLKRKKIRSMVVHLHDPDANSWIEKVDPNWSGAIPATIIYNNHTRQFYEQSFTYKELEQKLLSINKQL